MLTLAQRDRIVCHLQRGWKLPDSLVHELWSAYETLEQTVGDQDANLISAGDHQDLDAHREHQQPHFGTYDVDG